MSRYSIFTLLVLLFVACSTKENTPSSAEAVSESLDPKAFKSKIEATPDGVVLDVRTPEEVAQGVISGAKVINFKASDFDQQIQSLDKNKPYFVYCASGGRSGKTASLMKEKGFKNVYNLEGGITAWKEQGLEVVNP
jgi:phage shock protein E